MNTKSHWWNNDPEEKYWIEVTKRPDIGADLKAPKFDDNGDDYYSYSFVKFVRDGDIVFHYYKNKKAIVGFSIVDGSYYEDDIIWGAQGSSASKKNVEPYPRPGLKIGLKNFTSLKKPLDLASIRKPQSALYEIKIELEKRHNPPVYFPFSFSTKDGIKLLGPVQGYLHKVPKALIKEFSQLKDFGSKSVISTSYEKNENPGTDYRFQDENLPPSEVEPFKKFDPDVIDRGNKAHRKIQNSLANFLASNGIRPESPDGSNATNINFDIAWEKDGKYFIGEIKSTTKLNEEKQLRLGLGQVLRYASSASRTYKDKFSKIVPVLIAEEIRDSSWKTTCNELNVLLVDQNQFDKLL